MRRKAAVFFDRDGVLNKAVIKDGKPFPPADAESLVITPGAAERLNALKSRGFVLVCVTNQPDVARGGRTLSNVEEMNHKVRTHLPLDDLLTCFHDGSDNCDCRKPKPGMLLEAAGRWNLDLARSWMIGDRAGDIGAGRAAGCRTIFLDFDYAEPRPAPEADFTCRSLDEAAAVIMERICEDSKNEICERSVD